MPGPGLRRWLRLPRRNIYLSLYSPPVRGWIAQQIMKIAAAADSPTEIVLHVDSDGLFIRPLTLDFLMRPDGAVRFYRNPHCETHATHILWREVACRLLGLDAQTLDPGDYIGLCVVWRRSIVRRMIRRIEEVGGADWRKILAREPHFSEYTLYGLFVELLGRRGRGPFRRRRLACPWHLGHRAGNAAGRGEFRAGPPAASCRLPDPVDRDNEF